MDKRQDAISGACQDIDYNLDVLKVQVLNNLEALLNPDGKPIPGIDMKVVDTLVKKPLMLSVTKIGNARMVILKNNAQGNLPS